MAILDNASRRNIWSMYMEEASPRGAAPPIAKEDLYRAIEAMDNWIESNLVSLNQAIPQPARGAISLREKVKIFAMLVNRRAEVG